MVSPLPVSLEDIRAAARRIAGRVIGTPMVQSASLG
ncbi:hydroxyectoine utilization dehydratase EutB, partial [Rhizobium ruizarguesonis]